MTRVMATFTHTAPTIRTPTTAPAIRTTLMLKAAHCRAQRGRITDRRGAARITRSGTTRAAATRDRAASPAGDAHLGTNALAMSIRRVRHAVVVADVAALRLG